MSDALKNLVRSNAAKKKVTPQTERTPGRDDEVENNAGGYVFNASDKSRLERLLILGTASNTYYSDAETQAKQALDFIVEVIDRDEDMVRETVRNVSVEGRALRQDNTLFTLAALFVYGKDKAATRAIFNDVVRTATHLYEFCQYIEDFGGWGAAKRRAVVDWFGAKDADALAYQAIKYRSRSV